MIRRLVVVLSVLALSACREGPAEYELPARITSDTGGQLTLNVRDDRAPAWTAGSDSVIYAAESYPPFPLTHGLLLAMPRIGGAVLPLIDAVQLGAPRPLWLSAPRLSADHNRIAFVQITDTVPRSGAICPAGEDLLATEPFLDSATFRIRQVAGGAPDQAILPVMFQGITEDSTQHPFGLQFVIIQTSHPFQRHFEQFRVPFYRPSWSPDGNRIAFSDGLKIRIWTIGQSQTSEIPGTDDGILAAWSPDGTRIAYTRLERGGPREFDCILVNRFGVVVAFYHRIVYGNPNRTGTLITINVDGSQARDLGEGYAPAWTPDGRELVATRSGALWRIPADGSPPIAVQQTASGHEPAVSPDGNWLAFTRQQSPGNHDIWTVRLR